MLRSPASQPASLTGDGDQHQTSPAQLQQLRTSWEIDGIGIALSPHLCSKGSKYWRDSLGPQTSRSIDERQEEKLNSLMIIVTREIDYLTLHYITVTNSQHACAEFPIIDHKQLQWSGERESQAGEQ